MYCAALATASAWLADTLQRHLAGLDIHKHPVIHFTIGKPGMYVLMHTVSLHGSTPVVAISLLTVCAESVAVMVSTRCSCAYYTLPLPLTPYATR